MRINIRYAATTGIIFILLSISMTGCSKDSKKSAPQQRSLQTEQQSDKIPDQLKQIENNIEKIIKLMDGPAITTKDNIPGGNTGGGKSGEGEQQQGSSKEESSGSSAEHEKSGSQGSSKESRTQDSGKQDTTKQDTAKQDTTRQKSPGKDTLDEIISIVHTLHYQWNELMPAVIKKGAGKDLANNFGSALNNLTNIVISRNRSEVLSSASSMYAYIPDFYSLYRTPVSPEIKRIRHYTRSIIIDSKKANWTHVDSDIGNLKSSWALYKNTITKDQQEYSNKLDFSIYELDRVVKEKNQLLVDIKGRVAMTNIEALEKALEGT